MPEILGPPVPSRKRARHEQADAAALGLVRRLRAQQIHAAHQGRKLGTNSGHVRLQRIVEHVADHDHAALRPLPHST